MRRTFVSNLLLLLTVNLLVKPFYILGIETEIQNQTGPEIFGSYFALINFSFLINILPDLGTTNWNTRHIAMNPERLGADLPRLLALRLILAVTYFALLAGCGLWLGYSPAQQMILWVLGFNQILALTIQFLRSNLTGLHLFRQDSLVSILDRIVLVLGMGFLLWFRPDSDQPFRIEWLAIGQTVAYGMTAVAALFLLRRKAVTFRFKWEPSFLGPVLKESLPYAALILISTLSLRIDTVLIERICGAHEAGIYAMGFRFFDAFSMIAYLFATLLLPIFARMLKNGEDISPLTGVAFRFILAGSWILLTTGWLFRDPLLSAFYDQPSPTAMQSFSWLMCGFVFFSLQYVFGTLLTGAGRMDLMIRAALAGAFINIAGNLWLIPKSGAEGAAIINAVTQGLILVLQVWLARKYLQVRISRDYTRALIFVVLTSLLVTILYLLKSNNLYNPGLTIGLLLYGCSALLIAFASRVIDLRFIPELMRRE